ncbi:lysophosphatidylcholine acyltransferase 2-like [Actinia tenebrosa]|uniref:Lysophosphatidylcholine acyltransferase 2-like n=1 Tax=Actinia tenebrosa TaxID=6105 RepID=A0A6P8IKB0_ACTTE|nr:lysophosphatidylcholine acyltransferase 2-like [Actinia tenebrosa]
MSSKHKDKHFLRQKSLVIPQVQNPFSYSLHLTIFDKFKVVICTLTLFPIRVVGAVICLLFASILASLATAFLTEGKLNEPLTGIRKILKVPLRLCARACLFFFGFHWVKVKGKLCSSEEAPVLVVAPHSSFIDALALSVIGMPGGVSRRENDQIPIIGAILRCMQPIYVARNDVNSRQNTIAEIKRRTSSKGLWPHLAIFPEGTCTNRQCLITFKPGAFYAACPVQPVVLKFPNKLDTVTWTWSGPGALKLIWLTLCQFHNYLEIEILPVYKPSCEELLDAKLFARNVREQMASVLKVPVTEHTYEDCRLMLEATQKKLPASTGLVEYQKISTKLCVRIDSMKDLLHKFSEIDTNADGRVDLQEFAAYLNLPITPQIEELFSLYDRDESGDIDFREYLIGMALVAKPASSDDSIKLAFEVFDVNKDGRVGELELKHILQSAYPSIRERDINCIFRRIDVNNRGYVTYEEFYAFAKSNPEYAVIFDSYRKEDHSKTDPGKSGTVNEAYEDADRAAKA